ncbi:zinc dependent phospholipase C family protein [Occallatibacter savannae]|uniref:zinc dependent phospholipase C family protein n=1 Tax=Occallatibacter savannae TaxID=1002691 RepID=UPI000D68FF6C|nr:zinc dependent phospholipase C family protein [Occallatibacter savannae]
MPKLFSCRKLLHSISIRSISRTLVVLALLLISCGTSHAYSVLTHEELIDLLWNDHLRPMILARYPGLTDDQIREAHAYAYGGAVIQDMGYYPFGNKEFSDLVHYVRSGDFVLELIKESQTADEYAFALGALSHYAADVTGHPAVNQAVAITYPKLRAKFGPIVLYAQDKTAHIRTEFGFDMAQVAKERYAPQQYHDFIGFQVSKELLERVFPVIYGMQLKDVVPHEDLAIGSFRYSVSTLIPHMTQVALKTHKKEIMREVPNFQKKKFLYRLSRADYEKSWGNNYQHAGFGTRVLALILKLIPKVGPLKALDFNVPTPKTENLYFASINKTVDHYGALLGTVQKKSLELPDEDLDSGKPSAAGEYILADDTYAKMLSQLADKKFAATSAALRKNIVAFYANPSAPVEGKKDPDKWQKVQSNLEALKAFTPGPDQPPAAPSAQPAATSPSGSQ